MKLVIKGVILLCVFLLPTLAYPEGKNGIIFIPRSSLKIVPGGSSGQIQYNDNATFAGSQLFYDKSTGYLGIGIDSPSEALEVDGWVKAVAFEGDGSGLSGVITVESDPTVAASVKDGVSWGEVSNRPSGLDDGDDVGITSESDPTVAESVKDGVSWSEVSNRPSGLDDGDDVGITSESDPTVAESVKDGVSWSELSNTPAGFADGVDDIGGNIAKVAVVAQGGGDYTTPNAAVSDIASWCGTPSASNPCVIQIAPGRYTLSSTLNLSSYEYVSVVGLGPKSTFLQHSGSTNLLVLGSNSVVSDLSLKITSGHGSYAAIALSGESNVTIRNVQTDTTSSKGIYCTSSSDKLNVFDVELNVSGGEAVNLNTCNNATLDDVKFTQTGAAGNSGLVVSNSSGLDVNNLKANSNLTGGSPGYVVYFIGAVGTMRNSLVTAAGDELSGIELRGSAVNIKISNTRVELNSVSTSYYVYGIGSYAGSNVTMDLDGVVVNAPQTDTGGALFLYSVTTANVTVRNSVISCTNTNAVNVAGGSSITMKVANSMVEGAVTGTPVCFNTFDSSYNALNGVCK